jgi:antitoxin component of MazEF toxin-antitoxin module
MEFLRKTVKIGNSSGVILPKSLLGSEVKVTVVKRPVNIKKQVLKLLNDMLEDLRGIYLVNEKPIEVLAVSYKTKELLDNEKIKISIVPFVVIKRDIKIKPKLREKLMKAKTILNRHLLLELQKQIKDQS